MDFFRIGRQTRRRPDALIRTMWRNYLLLTYRNLLKNRSTSIINVLGLGVAIGCCIVAFLFLERRAGMDMFHQDADHIFLVESRIEQQGEVERWCSTPVPLGPALTAAFPQIQDYVRLSWRSATIQREEQVFEDGFWYVDPNYLDVFTFPLRYGDRNALHDNDALILSHDASLKYFGEENPVGKQISIHFDDTHSQTFTVRGVAKPFPHSSSFRFNILVPYGVQQALGRDLNNWRESTSATFIKLTDPSEITSIRQQMDRFVALQQAADASLNVVGFDFEELTDLADEQYQIRGAIFTGMHPVGAVVIPAIAVLLLVLSCFNYMNIAIGQATRRMKEIGVRKVMGGTRSQLIGQFMTENLVVCSLALVIGIYLARTIMLPEINAIFETWNWTSLEMSFLDDLNLWGFLIVLLVLTAAISGAYPALYVASFQATSIFRGRQEIADKSWFTRGLLLLQFVLAFYATTFSLVTILNAHYQIERDLGYEPDDVVVVQVKNGERYDVLAERLLQHPKVVSVAGSRQVIGRFNWSAVVEVEGEKMQAFRYDVSPDFRETLGLRMEAGRFFDEGHHGDAGRSVVINETFARTAGWFESPVGQQFRMGDDTYTIIGVVEDFHYSHFQDPIQPVFLLPAPLDEVTYLTARLLPGTGTSMMPVLEETWKALFPGSPLNGFFQDEVMESTISGLKDIVKVAGFQAVMALLLSCLGLFGLVSQNVGRRAKEIGIRKVLGASSLGIAGLVHRPFLLLLLTAAVLAAPLSYSASHRFLDGLYVYHVEVGPVVILLAILLVFGAVTIAIVSQVRRVLFMNPAEVLKAE